MEKEEKPYDSLVQRLNSLSDAEKYELMMRCSPEARNLAIWLRILFVFVLVVIVYAVCGNSYDLLVVMGVSVFVTLACLLR